MWGGNTNFATLIGVGLAVLAFAIALEVRWIAHAVRALNPQLLIVLFVGLIVILVFFQRQLNALFDRVMKCTVDRFLDPEGNENSEI